MTFVSGFVKLVTKIKRFYYFVFEEIQIKAINKQIGLPRTLCLLVEPYLTAQLDIQDSCRLKMVIQPTVIVALVSRQNFILNKNAIHMLHFR